MEAQDILSRLSAEEQEQIELYYLRKYLMCIESKYLYSEVQISKNVLKSLIENGNIDERDWNYISGCQILSEDFIRQYKDFVNWSEICYYQILSENFIREMFNAGVELDWYGIFDNENFSDEFKQEFKNILQWSDV